MKLASAASILCLALVACASSPKSEPVAASSASLTSADADAKDAPAQTPTAAEEWAEKKVAAEVAEAKGAPRDGADPLAMNSELEESSIPSTEITPASQVRRKSPGELNKAIGVVKTASSVDGAAKKLTQRLGKPSWTESSKSSPNAKRRVWIAPAGGRCHRLVLEPDGSVEVETASKSEWRMLTVSARQNPCTGEIKRGISHD